MRLAIRADTSTSSNDVTCGEISFDSRVVLAMIFRMLDIGSRSSRSAFHGLMVLPAVLAATGAVLADVDVLFSSLAGAADPLKLSISSLRT